MVKKLDLAETDDARRQATARVAYILSSGSLEYQREYARRVRYFPDDFRKSLVDRDGTIVSRPIGREESEILRYSCAIPAFPSIDILSSVEMQDLADMFEGWAQSDLTNCINVARLHGWADGLRSLVEVVGADYHPPAAKPGARVSLLKFMALKMFG